MGSDRCPVTSYPVRTRLVVVTNSGRRKGRRFAELEKLLKNKEVQ